MDEQPDFSTNGHSIAVDNPNADRFKIELGEPDRFNRKRPVRLLDRGRELHRDCFDPDSEFHRKQFGEGAWLRFTTPAIHRKTRRRSWRGSPPMRSRARPAPRPRRCSTGSRPPSSHGRLRRAIRHRRRAGGQAAEGIFGSKKALKTNIMLDMAISLATQRPFLGFFHVDKRYKVAVFSWRERSGHDPRDLPFWICRAAGVELEDTGIIFSDKLPQLGHLLHMDALEKYLIEDGIEICMSTRCIWPCRPPATKAASLAMGALLPQSCRTMPRCLGVTCCVLHHMRKGVVDQYAPGDLDDASWAGFAEFARGWLLLNRREKYKPGTGMHKLWLSIGGSVGHSSLWGLDDSSRASEDGPGTPHSRKSRS